MTSASEIAAILRLARVCDSTGARAGLARLVAVEGSHYRRPGARMLLAEDGHSAGAISAGCLEADLRRRLPEILEGGETAVIDYDSRTFEDLVWGLGTGCNGLVRVLLSPFEGALREAHEKVALALAAGKSVRLATVVAPNPASGRRPGDILGLDGAAASLEDPGGLFLEEIHPAIALLIAGAGPDAVPLARMATGLGWIVRILSPRDPAFLRERFRGLEVEFAAGVADERPLAVHGRSAAVVMSHDFHDDAAVLGLLLARAFPYLGVLGPRERTARLLRECGATEAAPSEIHSPAGLDLGAETAEEIALSIVSEIQEALGRARP